MNRDFRNADHDDAWAGVIGFMIAWCIGGFLGLVPWSKFDYPHSQWHMEYHNAWPLWALFVTLFATAVGFIVYAVKRWG